MINNQLVNYFSFYLKKGYTKDVLKAKALEKGWHSQDIEDSLLMAGYNSSKPNDTKSNDTVLSDIKTSLTQDSKQKNDLTSDKVNSINLNQKTNDSKTGILNSNDQLQTNKPVSTIETSSIKDEKLKGIDAEKKEIEKRLNELSNNRGQGFSSYENNSNESVVESYDVMLDNAKVIVEIKKEGSLVKYNLKVPSIGAGTLSLLNDIRNKLVSTTSISMKEITDPSSFSVIKQRFMNEANNYLSEKVPNLEPDKKVFLIGKLIQDMLGLGEIEFLVNDINLEEIVIPCSKENIRVYHKRYGWLLSNLKVGKEDEIINYSNIVARRVGRQITVLTPLLDAHLVSGDRVNAILYPISSKGNTITIRKFARDPYTMIDLINSNTCTVDVAVILWLAIEYEMNVIISGGTASGKTTILNAIMPFIPPNHRIISVEDTRELMLPEFLYWTPLVTRLPNPEGKGEVTMLDLLINSLRMRPDRIILGEMRRQEEAMVMFEAMHTGHSVYATLHADSASETVNRLTHPPLSVPPNLLKAVNLNVVVFRDRRKGIRRILQIAEFEADQEHADANILYRWVAEADKLVKHAEHSRFFETIGKNTGMSDDEITKNLDVKKQILNFLIKNKIRDLNDFGKVMKSYYTDKQNLLDSIKRNDLGGILAGN